MLLRSAGACPERGRRVPPAHARLVREVGEARSPLARPQPRAINCTAGHGTERADPWRSAEELEPRRGATVLTHERASHPMGLTDGTGRDAAPETGNRNRECRKINRDAAAADQGSACTEQGVLCRRQRSPRCGAAAAGDRLVRPGSCCRHRCPAPSRGAQTCAWHGRANTRSTVPEDARAELVR